MTKFCDFCANDDDWRDLDSDEGEFVGPTGGWFCAKCLLNYDIVGCYNKREREKNE